MEEWTRTATHLRVPEEDLRLTPTRGWGETAWTSGIPTASAVRTTAAKLCDLCTFSMTSVRSGWRRARTCWMRR